MSHHAFTIDLHGPGVPVLRLSGLPDQAEIWVTIGAASTVRTLWPVRGLSARLPEHPLEPGLPSLAAIVRNAISAAEVSDAG